MTTMRPIRETIPLDEALALVMEGARPVLPDPVLRRRSTLEPQGSRSLVAWNPGAEAAARMADVGDGWRDYVCLEAANAGPDVVTIPAGGRHVLQQTLSVQPL